MPPASSLKSFDYRKWLPLLAFFGVTSMGSCTAYLRGPIIGWLVGPAMDAQAAEFLPIERHRTDSVIQAEVARPLRRMESKVRDIQELIQEMPEGKKAAARIKRRDDERIFRPADEPRRRADYGDAGGARNGQ